MAEPLRIPRIKVCGLRAIDDLPSAIPAALDAVGFVTWSRSKRNVDAATVARVVAKLPERILPIVVMVDPFPEDAERFLRDSGARALQLCGYEIPDEWIGFPYPILRRVGVDPDESAEIEDWAGVARAFVLDHPSAPGGTGARVDVEVAREFARRAPCLLAGGLTPDNVVSLVHLVRPQGVDASSALEDGSGRKIPARVTAFIAAADAALRALETREGADA